MKIKAIKYVKSLFWCKNHGDKPHDWVMHRRRNHKGEEDYIFQITVEKNGREENFYAIILRTLNGRIYAEIRKNLPDYKDWTEDTEKMEIEAWRTLTRSDTAVRIIEAIYDKLGIMPQWEHDFGLLTFAKPLFFTYWRDDTIQIARHIYIHYPHRAFEMEIRFPDNLVAKLPKHKNISHEIELIDGEVYVIIKIFKRSGEHTWSIYWKPNWLFAINERDYRAYYIHDKKINWIRYAEFALTHMDEVRIRFLNNKLRVCFEENKEVSNEDTKME